MINPEAAKPFNSFRNSVLYFMKILDPDVKPEETYCKEEEK